MMKMRKWRIFCLTAALIACFLGTAQAQTAVQAGGMQYSVADYGFLPGLQTIVPTAGNQFLSANLIVKAGDSASITDPEQLLLAVDEGGRAYLPILFNGSSAFTASLKPGEKSLRVLFEVPKAAGSYRLAVLDESGGGVAGMIQLGKSIGPALAADGEPLATVSEDGYGAVIHGVTQSKTALLDKAPDGMKYVWVDATFTGAGTQTPVSELASQWAINNGGGAEAGIVPVRAHNMLAAMNVRFNDQLPAVRGRLCFLVPEGWTQLTGLTAGETPIGLPLPVTGEMPSGGMAQLNTDGAYDQAGWKVTIHGMRLSDKGKLADPPAGSRYATVNLTLANASTQNLKVSSELAFAMTDGDGNELVQAWFADLNETLDASLLPGESITGEVAFLLPDDAKAGVFRVHLNMLGEPLLIDAAGYLAQ